MRSSQALVAAALSLLLPGAVQGVDGVVEISQAAALAGGITPDDEPGFPVMLDQAGSYRLTSALSVPADTNGIEITADDVSLDLNGFRIAGPVVCSGVPPNVTCPAGAGRGISGSSRGTRVVGGTVSGFADGAISLGALGAVADVLVRSNGRVGIEVGERSHVNRARVTENDGNGISAGADSVVSGNDVVGNSGVGIALGVGAGLAENVISENGLGTTSGGVLLSDNVCDRDTSCTTTCTDSDADGAFTDCTPLDCDDTDAQNFPGNAEICDSQDNDCDGVVDEGGVCVGMSPGPGDLQIREVMASPATATDDLGEWFELENVSASQINVNGCEIQDAGGTHTIVGAPSLPVSSLSVFALNSDASINGGLQSVTYQYADVTLNNSASSVRIMCGASLIDEFFWGSTSSGASLIEDSFGVLCEDTVNPYGAGGTGTPGAANPDCPL